VSSPSTPPPATNIQRPQSSTKASEDTYPVIGFICLLGIFLHLLIEEPLMYMMGLRYGEEEGSFWEKQHLGTYLVLLSFFLLLWRRRDPFGMLVSLYRSERVFTCLLGMYVWILLYMIAMTGAKGVSFLIDTQFCNAVAALVTPNHRFTLDTPRRAAV